MAYYCFEVEFAQTQPQNIQKFNLLIGWPVQHRLHRWTSSWGAIFSITHWPPKIKVTMFNVLYFTYSILFHISVSLFVDMFYHSMFICQQQTNGLLNDAIQWLEHSKWHFLTAGLSMTVSDIKILQTHYRSVNVKRVVQTKHIFSPCFMLVGLWR